MSSGSQPNAQDADELEAAVDQAIEACGGDMRSTIRALMRAEALSRKPGRRGGLQPYGRSRHRGFRRREGDQKIRRGAGRSEHIVGLRNGRGYIGVSRGLFTTIVRHEVPRPLASLPELLRLLRQVTLFRAITLRSN
jgi:hypothetical protein